MINSEKRNMFIAVALLSFAALACTIPRYHVNHDFQKGLAGWRYYKNGSLDQETRYAYNESNELVAIEFIVEGQPDFISSYMEYFTVKDSQGKEKKYRVCVKRISYASPGRKSWEENIEVIVAGNMPRLKSIKRIGSTGRTLLHDVYEYDDHGRKISATRNRATGIFTEQRHEYTYNDEKNLGVVPEEYYFFIPPIFFNRRQFIPWRTLADEGIKTGPPIVKRY